MERVRQGLRLTTPMLRGMTSHFDSLVGTFPADVPPDTGAWAGHMDGDTALISECLGERLFW